MGSVNENWILEKAAETTKDVLVALLASERAVPPILNKESLSPEEQWKRYGQCVGLMYAQIFDTVASTLRSGKS